MCRRVSVASDSTKTRGEFAARFMRRRSCLSFSHAAAPSGSSSNRATSASKASGPVPAINCKCGVVLVICLVYVAPNRCFLMPGERAAVLRRSSGTELPPLCKLREEATEQFWEGSKLRR